MVRPNLPEPAPADPTRVAAGQVRRLPSSGLVTVCRMGIPWDEEVGAVLTRLERMNKYGGGKGGIEPSATSDNVFIYSDPQAP